MRTSRAPVRRERARFSATIARGRARTPAARPRRPAAALVTKRAQVHALEQLVRIHPPVVARRRPRRLPVPKPVVGAVRWADARARSSYWEYRVHAVLSRLKAGLPTRPRCARPQPKMDSHKDTKTQRRMVQKCFSDFVPLWLRVRTKSRRVGCAHRSSLIPIPASVAPPGPSGRCGEVVQGTIRHLPNPAGIQGRRELRQ